jgi:hypothetical protein
LPGGRRPGRKSLRLPFVVESGKDNGIIMPARTGRHAVLGADNSNGIRDHT